jgi:hypothetical protein
MLTNSEMRKIAEERLSKLEQESKITLRLNLNPKPGKLYRFPDF